MEPIERRIEEFLDADMDIDFPAESLMLAINLLLEAILEIKYLKGGGCCGRCKEGNED